MSEFTKTDAIRIIQSRKLVPAEANGVTMSARVISIGNYTDEEDKQFKIVNLGLMNSYHVAQAKEKLAEGDLSGATNQHYSRRIPVDAKWCPAVGSTVEVVIEEITTSNNVTGQFITSMSPLASVSGGKVSLSLETEEEETLEEVIGAKK